MYQDGVLNDPDGKTEKYALPFICSRKKRTPFKSQSPTNHNDSGIPPFFTAMTRGQLFFRAIDRQYKSIENLREKRINSKVKTISSFIFFFRICTINPSPFLSGFGRSFKNSSTTFGAGFRCFVSFIIKRSDIIPAKLTAGISDCYFFMHLF